MSENELKQVDVGSVTVLFNTGGIENVEIYINQVKLSISMMQNILSQLETGEIKFDDISRTIFIEDNNVPEE